MRYFIANGLCSVALLAGCARPTPVGEEPAGGGHCPPPPPAVFTQAGVDIGFAAQFPARLKAGINLRSEPRVLTLASQAATDDRIRVYLRCLSLRDGYSPEQAAYLEQMGRFALTKPTADEFIIWAARNPFPGVKGGATRRDLLSAQPWLLERIEADSALLVFESLDPETVRMTIRLATTDTIRPDPSEPGALDTIRTVTVDTLDGFHNLILRASGEAVWEDRTGLGFLSMFEPRKTRQWTLSGDAQRLVIDPESDDDIEIYQIADVTTRMLRLRPEIEGQQFSEFGLVRELVFRAKF